MLSRKMLRDIRKNKVQFTAIFLMMFFGCFLFSGITGEWNGLKEHFQEYRTEQNMADFWAFKDTITEGGITEADLQELKESSGIQDVEGRMVIPMIPADNNEATLDSYFANQNRISQLYIQKGDAFDSRKKGIWLDNSYAQANHHSLGDWITLQYQGTKVEGEILGLVSSPEYIYGAQEGQMMPDHKHNGFAWVSPSLLPPGIPILYNQIAGKSAEGIELETIQKDMIQKVLGTTGITFVAVKDHPSVSMIESEIAQHCSMGTTFSMAFLLIAMMIAVTTMHRTLRNQRTQIGILKALGFTKGKLLLHYLSHNIFICLSGALGGYIFGYRLIPELIYRFMRELYVLPVWEGYLPFEYYLLPIGCTVITTAIGVVICRGYLKPNAADTLYGEEVKSNVRQLPKGLEALDFSGRWNLRDIGRNRLRSLMTLCGILGCTALLFCAFALFDTFSNLSDWTFHKQQEYQCKITELPNQEGQQEVLDMTDGEYLMEGAAVILESGVEKEVSLTIPETTKYLKMAEDLDTFIEVKNGIALSKKTADNLGVKVGDRITWKMKDMKNYTESQIKAIIRTPLSQGITMMKRDYEQTGQTYEPTAIIGVEPKEGFGIYADICTISHQNDLTASVDDVMEGMVMMIVILVIAAVLLGSVMLYNLGVLSYLERYREFATMKVLGFADGRIRKIMIQQNVWLSVTGILLGVPAGYGLLIYMLSTVQESMDIPIYIKSISWMLSILGTLLLSWIISKIVSRKIPRINMVEALKARE